MESVYILIIGFLFLLAITDLTVGVSNDATNFLAPAIGSKSGKFWVVMIVASLGVIIGAIFSSGMMEVARNSVFHPKEFVFSEIIIIFLAVMITDVILLDFFNTFGFPTSTTVSLVFGLLGAAVGISLIKISSEGGVLSQYINSDKALAIISGILVSVVIAFTFGVIIQFLARLLFSFDLKKTYRYFGALWGGLSFAVITYFMFIKGFKGSVLADTTIVQYALHHELLIFVASFILWAVIFQVLIWFTKINVLKIVVLTGTFALAMAFAGNDLVNFVGVPIAGLFSYQDYIASGVSHDLFTMESLSEKVQTPVFLLLMAGLIMVITLWTSKKAKSVTETSIKLSKQDSGYERFGSTALSRSIVRVSLLGGNFVASLLPSSLRNAITQRFENIKLNKEEVKEAPAFDLVRASVNLVVSSILIAIGTAYKLPLSTTYVTFMVAMGSSLADGAWGRESAVYRVSGVISVIGGWFITALVAFLIAFLIAIFIHWGGVIAVSIMAVMVLFIFYRTKIIHKRREKENEEQIEKANEKIDITEDNVFSICTENVLSIVKNIPELFSNILKGLETEDRKLLKKAKKKVKKMNKETREFKSNIHKIIRVLKPSFLNSAQYHVQVIDYLRETSNAIQFIATPSYDHIDNNHQGFAKELNDDLEKLKDKINNYTEKIISGIEGNNFSDLQYLEIIQEELLHEIEEYRTFQLVRIKNDEIDNMSSILYLNILAETKNLSIFLLKLFKAQKYFIESKSEFV